MAVLKKSHTVIFSIFLFFLTTVAAHAAEATFSWTANSEPVSGYKIHYGTSSRNYTFVTDVKLPEAVNGSIVATVQGLQNGITYYFAATAYSATEDSDYSIEVVYTVPGDATPSQPPIADNISLEGSENTPLSGQLNAISADGTPLTFTVTLQPGHGTLAVDETTGSFSYTPALNYAGNDTFSFTASNSAGTSSPATVTILLSPANNPPVADNIVFSVNEDSVYSGTLSATDTDGDNLIYSLVAQPHNGTVAISSSGTFTYIPGHGISGTDSFTFKVSDGSSDSNTAQVNVTIQHVNKAPIAQNRSFSVDQGVPYSGQLVATDENGDVVHFSIATAPEKGNLLLDDNGSFTYTPDTDALGADLFTFVATDGTAASDQGTINILINAATNDLAFELGELVVTSNWQHVDLSNQYLAPSIIAKSNTMNDPEAGIVSIRNLTSSGFDIRIREWDNVDGFHPEETVSFMAMERGHHQIAQNVYAVADCISISGINTFQPINFTNSFSSQPVVLSSIVTENESNAAILRMSNITPQGYSITMQEQENNDGSHGQERVCYIAMEKWSGVVDGLMIETGSTEKILTDKTSTVSFKQQFPTTPFVLADMQSANDIDTAILGMSNLSVTNTGMTILEEQSADNETSHVAEIGGYFAITPYNPDEDSDNDGLTNEAERIIHTHPGLWDTDQDAINDGNEYRHWLNLGISPEVDSDGDGIPNLQDNDSDNDGVPDGVEIFKGFDPTSRQSLPSFKYETGERTVGTSPVWISFKNSYIEPVVFTDTVTGNNPDQIIVLISNITANGCSIQLQANDYLDTSHNMNKISFIVTENYVAAENQSPEPTVAPKSKSRRFNAKTMSSLIFLYSEAVQRTNKSK